MSYYAFAATFDEEFFTRLEHGSDLLFQPVPRHDIRRFSLDAFEAFGGSISKPPYAEVRQRLERLSKSIARTAINLAQTSADDRAGNTANRLVYRHLQLQLPDGTFVRTSNAVAFLTSVLNDARMAIDASLVDVNESASAPKRFVVKPLWPLDCLILELADVFESAGGNANADYQSGKGQLEGPFLRFLVILCNHILSELVEPDPEVATALAAGAVKARARRLVGRDKKALKIRSDWQSRRGRRQEI